MSGVDYQKIGQVYRHTMTEEARQKAMTERTTSKTAGKAMTSIVVGTKAGAKALVMSAAQFEAFKKGFFNE